MTSLGVQITKRIKESRERTAIQAGKILLHNCIPLMIIFISIEIEIKMLIFCQRWTVRKQTSNQAYARVQIPSPASSEASLLLRNRWRTFERDAPPPDEHDGGTGDDWRSGGHAEGHESQRIHDEALTRQRSSQNTTDDISFPPDRLKPRPGRMSTRPIQISLVLPWAHSAWRRLRRGNSLCKLRHKFRRKQVQMFLYTIRQSRGKLKSKAAKLCPKHEVLRKKFR